MDVWGLVHAERYALIDDLSGLTAEQWATDSGCAGWTVEDVAAHLVGNAKSSTTLGILRDMVRARFNFDRMNARAVAADRGTTPQETLARLRQVADRTDGPPSWMAALPSRLVEEIAHGEDIRRPLGLHRTYPDEAVVAAIEYQLATPDGVGGAKSLARKVRLVATDVEFAAGTGPEVRGPALELLMLATGRKPAEATLHGAGVAVL